MEIILFIVILGFAFVVGTMIETSHFSELKKREASLLDKPYTTFEKNAIDPSRKIRKIELVSATVVIGSDYFKEFLGGIQNIFGGRLSSFEANVDRARREAVLRVREMAIDADIIINLKIDSCNLNGMTHQKQMPRLSILAYGTAITYEK